MLRAKGDGYLSPLSSLVLFLGFSLSGLFSVLCSLFQCSLFSKAVSLFPFSLSVSLSHPLNFSFVICGLCSSLSIFFSLVPLVFGAGGNADDLVACGTVYRPHRRVKVGRVYCYLSLCPFPFLPFSSV